VSPPGVTAALAGPKDYVGTWRNASDSTLVIQPTGELIFEKHEGRGSQSVHAAIASFAGDDIQVKVFVSTTIHVSEAPHQVAGRWQITVDGITLQREPEAT
jgi:hypothetical protein